MNKYRKSDSPVVPMKLLNKANEMDAERVEGRELAKRNSSKCNTDRTQSRTYVTNALERVRHVAKEKREEPFTALLHHVYNIDHLRVAYDKLKRDASAGIDGETWRHYGESLEENLEDLSQRVKQGAYRAKPVRRVYIPKASGGQRPLGVCALEDKIVQRSVVMILNSIYEEDFLGFSYGFRPGRSPHQALDALSVGIMRKKVGWVLAADIRGFFDNLNHDWLIKFIQHRVRDQRVVRLIQKWLKAGVLDRGKRIQSEVGTVQGGSISPLLANVYLHYVLDLWVQWWRKQPGRGDVIIVRSADDFVMGFQNRNDAEQFLRELRKRLSRFGLELQAEKTRLIEFGRFAVSNHQERGRGKPETFNFLGFTHICAKTLKGKFTIRRQTMKKRWQAKLKEVKSELRRQFQKTIPEQGAYLRSVILGHMQYYGVPMNGKSLNSFRYGLIQLWCRSLRRRSQKHRLPWTRMQYYISRWIPYPRICHPYPFVAMASLLKAGAGCGNSARPDLWRGQ